MSRSFRPSTRRLLPVLLAAAAVLLWPGAAEAQWDFGVRGGVYTDAEAGFVGFEGLTQVGRTQWFFNPNVEIAFPDERDLITVNGDFHYDFPTEGNLAVWVGGGPAVIFDDPDDRRRRRADDDDTDFGANLIAGIGMKRSGVRPYLQGKVILADETEAVIAVGLRFF
jgi:hypothetical protein